MIKVIVAITSYNLEKFIAQALDSVLAQKTNFEYKIIIADDCSTDNTLNIIMDYRKKHPNKIEVLSMDVNIGSLKNSNRIFDGLKCEYFSFLDGDDYWVGEDRLQKQIDFLDNNKEYSMCAGDTLYLKNGDINNHVVPEKYLNKKYTFNDFLKDKMPFFHTSAITVRNTIFINGLPKCYREAEETFENCALRGEDFRRILHLEMGPLYAFDEVFSVYRIHDKGFWQGSTQTRRLIESVIGWNFYSKYFNGRYGDFFRRKTTSEYRNLMQHLFLETDMLSYCDVKNKDAMLLGELIKDLSNNELIINNKPNRLKYLLKKYFLKLYNKFD